MTSPGSFRQAVDASRPPVFRFAPSPNGPLHIGHAFSALLNQKLARERNGRLLVRLENFDQVRCTPSLADDALEDLAWLGLRWEEPVLQQAARLPAYAIAVAALQSRGLLYPCTCTRSDIRRAIGDRADWPRDPDGSPLYPGLCRDRSRCCRAARPSIGTSFALRVDIRRALDTLGQVLTWMEYAENDTGTIVSAQPELWGDAVLVRKDVPTSYHLAVVVDDAAQGVTDIVRGDDLRAATGLHRLLQDLLGLAAPTYRHHRLIRDSAGTKLSKSASAPSLRAARQAGTGREAIWAALGFS